MRTASLLGIVAAAAIVAFVAGCSLGPDASTAAEADEVAAKAIAQSIADPATGTLQEMTDLGSCFFGHWWQGPQPWKLFREPNVCLFLRDGLEKHKLVWVAENNDYELTETRSVTADPVEGTASTLSIAVAFFTSTDASGTGVPVAPLTEGGTAFTDIHSITYGRRLQGTFVNHRSGIFREHDVASSFVVTGLDVDGSPPGFTVDGGRTGTFTNTRPDGTTAAGSITETITSPIVVTAVLQDDGSWRVSATGIIEVVYNAVITRADGSTETISRTATIILDGERIIHIHMGRMRFRADITTGEVELEG